MAPNEHVDKPQQSNGKANPELVSNPGSATSTESNTRPSVEHNPATSHKVNNSSTRLLNGSHTKYSTVGVPVPADGVTIQPEHNDESENPTTESGSFWEWYKRIVCFRTSRVPVPADGVTIQPEHNDESENRTTESRSFWEWYKMIVVCFRKSIFGHVFVALLMTSLFLITSFAAIVGFPNRDFCPQAPSLPFLVSVVGVVGVIFAMTTFMMGFDRLNGVRCTKPKKVALVILFGLFLFLTAIEISFVGHLHPSFDPTAEDYCIQFFYEFVTFKQIFVPSAIIVAALIYLPESSLQSWCRNCPAPSPAGAFFRRNINL